MQAIPKHELMSRVIQQSFQNWASKDKLYSRHYKKLDAVPLQIINDGLSEIGEYRPYHWDVWWMKSHMRYYKQYKQTDMRMVYQMVYNFLSLYARGKLATPAEVKKTRQKKIG